MGEARSVCSLLWRRECNNGLSRFLIILGERANSLTLAGQIPSFSAADVRMCALRHTAVSDVILSLLHGS